MFKVEPVLMASTSTHATALKASLGKDVKFTPMNAAQTHVHMEGHVLTRLAPTAVIVLQVTGEQTVSTLSTDA